jgi:hypothetical protein
MAYYEINLIKDSVTRASRRRLIRWILFVYILGCGAAVVAICYRGAQNLVALREQRDRVERLERHLLADTAAARDVPQSVKALYGDLASSAEKLARADAFLGQRIFVVPILLGLVAPLPSESALANLEVDQKNGSLRFDLIMPINPADHVTHSSLLLAAWNGDPHLVKRVQDIRLVTTQQKNIRGRKVFVAHFEGTLRSKG